MIRRPPRSTRTEHSFPTRRSSDLDPVSVNVSGRYDRYSGGLDNFSPKVGVKFTPIQQVVLRGTYSRGFRVPSFGEADATFPTTGYVRSEEHTSELQSLMRISYAVFCLKKTNHTRSNLLTPS